MEYIDEPVNDEDYVILGNYIETFMYNGWLIHKYDYGIILVDNQSKIIFSGTIQESNKLSHMKLTDLLSSHLLYGNVYYNNNLYYRGHLMSNDSTFIPYINVLNIINNTDCFEKYFYKGFTNKFFC